MQILGLIIDIKLHGSFPVIMTVSEANSDFVTYVKQNGILLHSEALLLNVSCLMVLMLFFISLFFSDIRLWSGFTIEVGSVSRARRVRH